MLRQGSAVHQEAQVDDRRGRENDQQRRAAGEELRAGDLCRAGEDDPAHGQRLPCRQASIAGSGAADEAEGEDAHAHRKEGAQAVNKLCALAWDLRHGALLRIE